MKNILLIASTALLSLYLFNSCKSQKRLFIDEFRQEIPRDEEGKININVSHKGSTMIFEIEPIGVEYSYTSVKMFELLAQTVMSDNIYIGTNSSLYEGQKYFDHYEVFVQFTDKRVLIGNKPLKFE
ncbi:hypothetical protein [Flammeovirga sp. EKP202]|uniref:hypothetical protein n=1 Tax=Flammeovirga sp. EKP202 TaxID=2770592 RepID=UPI00165EEFB6|nr:hypothetical protein [Flammeovirga sp. EKP202]MBD0405328.1 hypothetical protein [Flammeovirga sp. EKP202]